MITKAKASDDPIDESLRALDWWYPEDELGEPKMEAVLAEINGWKTDRNQTPRAFFLGKIEKVNRIMVQKLRILTN